MTLIEHKFFKENSISAKKCSFHIRKGTLKRSNLNEKMSENSAEAHQKSTF